MSFIKSANQPIQSEHIKNVPVSTNNTQFGKNDHDYITTSHKTLDEFEKEENNKHQADDKSLSTASALAAIAKIESELKLLCSLQVHNSNQSSTINPSHTNLEPSVELPTEDTLFLQGFLNDPEFSSLLENNSIDDIPGDSFNKLFSSDHDMIYKDLNDMPMEQGVEYFQDIGMTTSIPSNGYDDRTSSVGSVSDDNERDDINRRGLKKSGGPVRKLARFGNKQVVKYSDEYHDRRVKNNEAVKKSRMKAKEKQKDTEQKMVKLAEENRTLSDRVDLLMKELHVLKSLYKELNQDLPANAVRELERVNLR